MPRPFACPAVLALTLAACGSSGGGGGTTPPSRVSPAVGGDYATAVTLTRDTCGGTTVLPLPTHVEHTAGASTFRLSHGPTTFTGTVAVDGAFTTSPATVSGGGVTSTLRLGGRFTPGGFEGDVDVTQEPPTPACSYGVHWVGTKSGAANVLG